MTTRDGHAVQPFRLYRPCDFAPTQVREIPRDSWIFFTETGSAKVVVNDLKVARKRRDHFRSLALRKRIARELVTA